MLGTMVILTKRAQTTSQLMLRPTLATDIFCYPLEFRTLLVASRANLNLIGRYINNLLFLLYHILVWKFIE